MLELCTPSDRYFDYCLWEYSPIADTTQKLRSVNLLNQSFSQAVIGEGARALVEAIRADLGESQTVWGVKQENGRFGWEFYFYDYDRQARSRSATRLLKILRPWMDCDIPVNEACDYFMFSFDFDEASLHTARRLEELNVYIGNVGSTVSSGICYSLTRSAMTMKNFYFFFDVRTQLQAIVDKLTSSVYLDLSKFDIDSVLWPELRHCQTIVLANKRSHDGIYFSRINVSQLLVFLRRLSYPTETIRFIEQRGDQLDHMLYDVGFDYRMQDGQIHILKSAYYGVF